MVLFAVATVVVAAGMIALFGPIATHPRIWMAGSAFATFAGMCLAFWATGWSVRHILATARLTPHLAGPILAIAVGTMLIESGLLVAIGTVVEIRSPDDTRALFEIRGAAVVVVLFAVVVVAPIVEELFVRGVLLRAVGLRFGRRIGLLSTAALFGLLHANALQSPMTFISGLVWGAVLLRTGNLAHTIVLHMINNGIVAVVVVTALYAGGDAPPAVSTATVPPIFLIGLVALGAAIAAVGAGLLRQGFRALPRDPERLARLWNVPLEYVLDRPPVAVALAPTATETVPQAAPGQP